MGKRPVLKPGRPRRRLSPWQLGSVPEGRGWRRMRAPREAHPPGPTNGCIAIAPMLCFASLMVLNACSNPSPQAADTPAYDSQMQPDVRRGSGAASIPLPCAAAPIPRLQRVEASQTECSGSGSWSARYVPLVACRYVDVSGAVVDSACEGTFPCGGGTLEVEDADGRRSSTNVVEPASEGWTPWTSAPSSPDVLVSVITASNGDGAKIHTALHAVMLEGWAAIPGDVVVSPNLRGAGVVSKGRELVLDQAATSLGRPLGIAKIVTAGPEDGLLTHSLGSELHDALLITRASVSRTYLALFLDVEAPVASDHTVMVGVDTWFQPGAAHAVWNSPPTGRILLGILAVGGCRNAVDWRACERTTQTEEERWKRGPIVDAPCYR